MAEQPQHRIKISRYNRNPGSRKGGKYWWADCSCGMYEGFDNQRDAEEWVCPRTESTDA